MDTKKLRKENYKLKKKLIGVRQELAAAVLREAALTEELEAEKNRNAQWTKTQIEKAKSRRPESFNVMRKPVRKVAKKVVKKAVKKVAKKAVKRAV